MKRTRKRFWLASTALLVSVSFGIYLWSLYRQMTEAFDRQEQSYPTRIYSDVTKIALGQPASLIETRLKALNYSYSKKGDVLQFHLRSIDYPLYLIPNNHPQLQSTEVVLQFESEGTNPIKSIQVGATPVDQVFLEPELIATLTRNGPEKSEIRTYLTFDQIPSTIWKAIIAVEDQHFLDHRGLDPRAVARAVWVNLKTFSLAQGGSTITQQLVKNLLSRRNKNFFRKINEVFLSFLLEFRFEKEQILERYLNEVYLGQVGHLEVHGVAEGAEHFFGKKIDELNLGEIALMAGLIRGPGYYSPYKYRNRALERQRLILKKMVETGLIAEEEAKAALQMPIRLAPPQTSVTKAPFFADYVKSELARLLPREFRDADGFHSEYKVYTTLDPYLNQLAQKSVTDGVDRLQKQFKIKSSSEGSRGLEGALVAVENESGYIRALVGGRNYAESNFNRILNMRRQVGSTFKPIVYLTAFQKGKDPDGVPYAPGRPVLDAPWTWIYDRDEKKWSPRNYEKMSLGWIPLRTAFAQSINTVASRVAYEVGLDAIVETARKLGISSSLPKVPSLSLGVAELSPIELAQVYSTLANRGRRQDLTVVRGILDAAGQKSAIFSPNSEVTLDPAPIDLLTECLQEVVLHGTAQSAKKLGFQQSAAGKTGTTSAHRDAWFAGFTPRLTTVVWVGLDQNHDQGSPTPLTGANSALPIWVTFMKGGQRGQPDIPFSESPLLTHISIDRHTGQAASSGCPSNQVVLETFIRGQEPEKTTCEPQWPPTPVESQDQSHAQ